MLTLFQQEFLAVLQAYLSGRRSLTDFRQWEVTVTDSDEIRPGDRPILERLALLAETVETGAAEESAFRSAARAAAQDVEGNSYPRVVTGTTFPNAGLQSIVVDTEVVITLVEEPTLSPRPAGRSLVEVTL